MLCARRFCGSPLNERQAQLGLALGELVPGYLRLPFCLGKPLGETGVLLSHRSELAVLQLKLVGQPIHLLLTALLIGLQAFEHAAGIVLLSLQAGDLLPRLLELQHNLFARRSRYQVKGTGQGVLHCLGLLGDCGFDNRRGLFRQWPGGNGATRYPSVVALPDAKERFGPPPAEGGP